MEYKRFRLRGAKEQKQAVEKLITEKHLSRDDLALILHTLAFRDPHFDIL